jgi:DNA repair photolyase
MPLTKSRGNMYTFVTHTHAHLGGACPHACSYCYVDSPRFGRPARYVGALRLIEKEFAVKYGEAKTIFIEHCNDLWAEDVPDEMITRVLAHCREWPGNHYVFQTKNPERVGECGCLPDRVMIGTTIETNRDMTNVSRAPGAEQRAAAMKMTSEVGIATFITVEPILDCDPEILASWIIDAHPSFVNIGADSKGHGLPEPTMDKVMDLHRRLTDAGVEVREKRNLSRLKVRP